jgi:hypothetical protein
MSDPRAIEAVTETLRNLVDIGVKEVEASAVAVARPPDRVADTNFDMQINLFLYQTAVEPALRNEQPRDLLPGETGEPALPLVLHYLLTPYANGGNDIDAHRMLGGALRILHEHSVLTRTELAQIAPYSDLARQVERIRITWQGLDEKDIYSLWSAFQSPYRLSAAFEVRVVLIDSRRPSKTPLPALRRGADDRGPVAQSDTLMPFPMLTAAAPPNDQPAAFLGDSVLLQGNHLASNTVSVRMTHPLLAHPVVVTAPQVSEITDVTVRFGVPDRPADLPAGLWSVSVIHTDPGVAEQVTNDVPLAVAPRITSAMPMAVARAASGTAVVNITCEPHVRFGQRVSLLLGEHAVPPQPFEGTTGALEFRVPNAEPGAHLSRLRVAGMDSPLVNRSVVPPAFDSSQTVTVT